MPALQHIRNPLANGTAERWYGHTPTPQRNEPHPLLVQASPRPLASMEASVDADFSGEALERDADSRYGDADMDPGYDGDADFDDLPPLTRSEQREVELRFQREGLAAKWAHLEWLDQQPVAREPFAPFDASVDAQRPMDLESIRAALQQDADTYQSSLEAFDELPRSVSEVEVSVEALPTPQEASAPAEDGHQQQMRQLLGFNLNTLKKIDTPITRPVENSITRMFSKGWATMDTTHPDLDAESQSRTEVDAAIDPGTDNEWD